MCEFSNIKTRDIVSILIYDVPPCCGSHYFGTIIPSLPLLGVRTKTDLEMLSYCGTILSMNKSPLVFPSYNVELTLNFVGILSGSEVDNFSIRNYENVSENPILASISFIDLSDGYAGIKVQISTVKVGFNVVIKGIEVLSATPSSTLEVGDFIMSLNGISFNILSNEMIISIFHALKSRRVTVLKSGWSFLPHHEELKNGQEIEIHQEISVESSFPEYSCSQSRAQWKCSRSRYILTRIFHHCLPPPTTSSVSQYEEGKEDGETEKLREHEVNATYFAAMRFPSHLTSHSHRYHYLLYCISCCPP